LNRLAKEAAALRTDPDFVDEMDRIANLLMIPLPAAIVSARTRAAVARRCSELAGSKGHIRHAAALLAGYLLAVVRWEGARRRHQPRDSSVLYWTG
jgi:hypothetical protein